jgi:hypothetical protein
MHLPFTELKEIDEPEVMSTVPPEVEELILSSFGHAIIEFEATLYQKFLVLTKGLVVTCLEFKEHLANMEERGIVTSIIFLGKPGWALGNNEGIRNIDHW